MTNCPADLQASSVRQGTKRLNLRAGSDFQGDFADYGGFAEKYDLRGLASVQVEIEK